MNLVPAPKTPSGDLPSNMIHLKPIPAPDNPPRLPKFPSPDEQREMGTEWSINLARMAKLGKRMGLDDWGIAEIKYEDPKNWEVSGGAVWLIGGGMTDGKPTFIVGVETPQTEFIPKAAIVVKTHTNFKKKTADHVIVEGQIETAFGDFTTGYDFITQDLEFGAEFRVKLLEALGIETTMGGSIVYNLKQERITDVKTAVGFE